MTRSSRLATAINVAAGVALLLAATGAPAQNAVRGKQLYETRLNPVYYSCSDGTFCHGPNPAQGMRNISRATNPSAILSAISSVTQMRQLTGYVTSNDAADIAAYIQNPAAATAATIATTATSLAFGATQVGTSNTAPVPATITITNTGGGNLVISAVNRSGTNAADFAATGTCAAAAPVTVAPGATCTLSARFTPSAAGTRTATMTLASNAATNPAIALAGTGSAVPVPSVNLSANTLAFPTQTVGTTSAARQLTLTNSGSAALTVTQVATSPNPEFAATSNCVGTINAGASCTIGVTFTPTAAGTRSGSLTITSNAPGSPNAVALSGSSVLTATPIATIASTSVAFPATAVGVMQTAQATTLTNTGNAALQIASVTLGGANPSDFRMGAGTTCAVGSLAVGANCRIEVQFQPQSAGSKSATVTVVHNGPGGATAVTVTGMAAGASGGGAASSSALAPSNVGGAGALAPAQAIALALSLLVAAALRRRLARR